MKYLLCIPMLTCVALASAQKIKITGHTTDTLQNPLPSATVMLMNPKDSSLVTFAVTKADGSFEFSILKSKEYILKATFMGFSPLQRVISAENRDVELGRLEMTPVTTNLGTIEITADQAPVMVKKDTIEFNASSFKTGENAVVEDLLKKLPGIEVDNEGNIKAQGQQVKNVTVDGKKFFGNDPKIASRNLPADAIDKVHVFDKLSDQSTFTGIDDGQREKTINLELKEEKRNTSFGSVMTGAGSDSRMQARASLNKFSNANQISFLGLANNVNQAGFGIDDYMNFTGGARQMMGGGQVRVQLNAGNDNGVPLDFGNRPDGLMSTYAAGFNVNNQFSKTAELNGSYFLNYLDHDLRQTTYRENFLPEGNYSSHEEKNEFNNNLNHRANISLDQKLDSVNTLRFNATAVVNESESDQVSSAQNISPGGMVINEAQRHYTLEGERKSLNSTLLYRYKFPKKGRSLSANLLMGLNVNTSTGLLDAWKVVYRDETSEELLRQTNDQSARLINYGATFSFTEPLGNRKYLEGNYNFRQTKSDVSRDVYDIADGETKYNGILSQNYNSDYMFHRAGLNFRIVQNDYNLVAGSALQTSVLSGAVEASNFSTRKEFINVLPSVRFNYDFSDSKHLRFDYESSVREPEIEQLQPVVDNRDPLNIYVGNPALRPSYSQSWRLNYTSFNPVSFINFFAFTDIALTTNAIINAQTIDEDFIRTLTPVNMGRSLRMNTNINFGFPIQKLSSRISITGELGSQQSIALINDQEADVRHITSAGGLRYTYEYKNIFDVSLNATMARQETSYELDQPDQSLVNTNFGAAGNFAFLKHYSLGADFEYMFYKNRSAGFRQSIPFLTLSASRFFLKNKSLELKTAITNVFNQKLSIEQIADINYLERRTATSLGRYVMLSLTYALNKQMNPMAMRRGGAMMRIRR